MLRGIQSGPGCIAEYARWDARDSGGTIDVFDQQERLFRSIVIEPAELADSGFVLPSV
jgi:hypothetical protein